MKLLTSKKMKLQKVENKDKNYACSIAILKMNGEFLNVLNYNRRNKTALYWSFLDKDEVKEVDEIVEENEKTYPRSIY